LKYQVGDEVLIVEGFQHMPGKNCQLSSLRKVLAFHGFQLSEEMLLGIASGLGFMYWNMKGMLAPFIGGLNGKDITIFENALTRLGGEVEPLKTGSRKVSYEQFKGCLRKGEPLIPFVDIAYLPYFFRDDAPYPNEDAGHFGGHTVVVYGVDEPNNTVHVSDRFNRPSILTIEQFMDAHSSKHPPFAANNRKLRFTLPEKMPELAPIIVDAIKENGDFMRNPPIKNFGIPGILKFKKMAAAWPKEYSPDELLWVLVTTWIYNQTGGTGGALFRNMYSDFLSEAYEIVGDETLKEASETYRSAAGAWDKVAVCLLPDELPSMRQIRLAFYENNRVQEEASPDYRVKLREIDERWKNYKTQATREAEGYEEHIPRLQEAIQSAYDLEAKAWQILGGL